MLDKVKVGKGAFYLMIGAGLSAVLKFISVPVLARLLTPEEFGIASVALALMAFGAILGGRSGFGAAVLYFQREQECIVETAFWAAFGLGCILFVIGLLFAEDIALFAGSSESEYLIIALSFLLPVDLLNGVGRALLARELKFALITRIELIASTFSALFGLIFAFYNFGAWALIGQYAIYSLLKVMGYFYCAKHKITLAFNINIFKKIFPYSAKLTLADVFMWASAEAPLIIVSKYLGVSFAGIFRVANRMVILPREIIGESLSNASFAGIAGMRAGSVSDDALRWSLKTHALALTSVFSLVAALSDPITRVVLGEQYANYGHVTLLVALSMAVQCALSGLQPYMKAKGLTSVFLWTSALRAVSNILGCYLGWYLYGSLIGVLLGLLVARTALALVFIGILFKITENGLRILINDVLKPVFISAFSGGTTYYFNQYLTYQVDFLTAGIISGVFWLFLFANLMFIFSKSEFFMAVLFFKTKFLRRKIK